MATSNSTDWSIPRDTVITMALRKLGVMASGGVPTATQISEATDSLQALVKAYQADGMALWKTLSQPFTTTAGTSSYTVGPSLVINCPRPLRVIQATITPSGATNYPLQVYNRYDFNNLPQGTNYTGVPVNFYYQPLRTSGVIKLWPTPVDSTSVITFHYISPYEDMDNSTDDFDFPAAWMMALIYGLAWVLSPEYGTPLMDRQQLQKESDFWHAYALSAGAEEGSYFLRPDERLK